MAEQVEHIKWVPNTRFMVDGFRFQSSRCKHYWLSHYHSDHTTGLTTSFSSGTIYCSAVTANLLVKDMHINPSCIQPLPLNIPLLVDGINVTLIDANHCPGAVLFLFKTPPPPGSEFSEQVILHTGDMRWHPRMGRHPALKNQRIDMLFLDTTYASPKHVFPCQEDAIADIVRVMKQEAKARPGTLFIMGSYRIGKERAYLGAAKALGWKVHVNADKLRVLRLLGLPENDMALLTRDAAAARIHVSFMGKLLTPDALTDRIRAGPWTHVVAFRPTGWSFQKSGLSCRREGDVAIYGVPYSEHSSFAELRDCVKTLRPRRIVPTVNASTPAAARALVDRFADVMDLSKDRSRLDFFLRKAKTAPSNLPTAAPCSLSKSCPIIPFAPAAATRDTHTDAQAAASGQPASAAMQSVHSAPAELAAHSAPGGACLCSEAGRGCDGEEENGCWSEACSERGEDADGEGDAAIDLVSPEKIAAPHKEWREQRSGVGERRVGEMREFEQGDNVSNAQRAERAAELVHLGLDSPPQICPAAEAPSAAAAAPLHSCASDEGPVTDPWPPESVAEADVDDQRGEEAEGRKYQCAWPQPTGRADPEGDSANDSWSSDSWDDTVRPASQLDAQDLPAKESNEGCDRTQLAQLSGCDQQQLVPGLRPEQLEAAHKAAAIGLHWKSKPAVMPAMHVGVEGLAEGESTRSRTDAEAASNSSSQGDRTEAVPKEAAVDLSAVDVAEQERILRMIELQRRAQPRKSGSEQGPTRKRGPALVAGGNAVAMVHGGVLGTQTKRRQLSIGAFIFKAPSAKD